MGNSHTHTFGDAPKVAETRAHFLLYLRVDVTRAASLGRLIREPPFACTPHAAAERAAVPEGAITTPRALPHSPANVPLRPLPLLRAAGPALLFLSLVIPFGCDVYGSSDEADAAAASARLENAVPKRYFYWGHRVRPLPPRARPISAPRSYFGREKDDLVVTWTHSLTLPPSPLPPPPPPPAPSLAVFHWRVSSTLQRPRLRLRRTATAWITMARMRSAISQRLTTTRCTACLKIPRVATVSTAFRNSRPAARLTNTTRG